ncbi:hydrophobic protein [Streptomyces sp. NPDC088788]|uniref:hydrophobic protein n=1 Tax=Streptomyces sp. NPDC088788 TaxID=3365898 RepID=UPI00382C4DCF
MVPIPIPLVLLVALILFGAGFVLEALWWISAIVLIVWVLGFVIRLSGSGGKRGHWYRW